MNKKARNIILSLVIAIVGIVISFADAFAWKSQSSVWLNIGCSLMASAVVILLTELLVNKEKRNPLEDWGIEKIYSTRAERNNECDPNLDQASYCVDAIVFGLSNFRQKYENQVEVCLKKGVNFRIMTMNPDGEYIRAREKEENVGEGHIEHTIKELVAWANELNKYNYKGKIAVKGYTCMTLDFYWRVDDEIFVGPYWYGQQSGNTITFSFKKGGRGFQQFENYFSNLWDNNSITSLLTNPIKMKANRKQ